MSCLTHESCRTFGDAMRDLDAKAVLRGDFILVRGDTVANVELKDVIKEHRLDFLKCSNLLNCNWLLFRHRAKEEDKNASLTLVYRQASPGHPCRTAAEEVVVAADAATGRVLHHQRATDTRVEIPVVRNCSKKI